MQLYGQRYPSVVALKTQVGGWWVSPGVARFASLVYDTFMLTLTPPPPHPCTPLVLLFTPSLPSSPHRPSSPIHLLHPQWDDYFRGAKYQQLISGIVNPLATIAPTSTPGTSTSPSPGPREVHRQGDMAALLREAAMVNANDSDNDNDSKTER